MDHEHKIIHPGGLYANFVPATYAYSARYAVGYAFGSSAPTYALGPETMLPMPWE
jgi:hypothetical protein